MATEAQHPNTDKLAAYVSKAVSNSDGGKPDKVSIYQFRDADGGYRISEISMIDYSEGGGMAGASWMASDPDAAHILFAAERFLLFCNEPIWKPEGWESTIDEAQEHEQRLWYAINNEFPEWEERATTQEAQQ